MVKLGDVCAKVTSGGTPSTKHPEYYGGGIPWLRTQEVNFSPIFATELSITAKGLENSAAKWIPANSVVVAMYGATAGRSAIAKIPLTTNQACCNLIVDGSKTDYHFVYYSLKFRYSELGGLAKGAAQTNLSAGMIKEFEIPLPPLPVQRRIADILSAYDDLIENNRRRIAILEETARLAYRKWFGGTTAGISTMGEICKTFGGGTPKTSVKEYWEGDVPWVVPTDITRNSCIALLDTERKITALGLEKSSAKMLPANAILMTSRASVGYFAVADFPVCTNQGFIGIVPHDTSLRWYILFNLMSRVEEIRNNAKGATFPEISRTRFRDMEIAVPDEESTTAFNAIVTPLMTQVRTLAKQSAQLASARDILLPRLMNSKHSKNGIMNEFV